MATPPQEAGAPVRGVRFAAPPAAQPDASTSSRNKSAFLEEELFYADWDHRHAHGHGDRPDGPSLPRGARARNSTWSLMPRLSESHITFEAPRQLGFDANEPPIHAQAPGSPSIIDDHDATDNNNDDATSTTTKSIDPSNSEPGSSQPIHTAVPPSVAPLAMPSRPVRRRRSSVDDTSVMPRRFLINVEETKRAILAQEDTDGDCQITIQDAGPKSFAVGTANSGGFKKFEIRGTYALSNLLQELALASDYDRQTIILDETRLNENPVERMTRLIKFHFWDALTRRIDADGLEKICEDPKDRSDDHRNRIYVPFHDAFALQYYERVAAERPHLKLVVIKLPEVISPEYVKSINTAPGILSLALREQRDLKSGVSTIRGAPFVVPGGRFNEMYGWDSYFEALGLLVDGRAELARGMVENFWYEIEHYGKILNANRSYYLTRSQPPFLTDMVIQVHKSLAQKIDWTAQDLQLWLARGIRASIKEHLSVWKASPRLDAKTGLSKFHPEGLGMPPETESTHFAHIILPYAQALGISIDEYSDKYNSGEIREPELDSYFIHDRAVRESGHDTTYRFEKRCANLATVDLNSLVYKYEVDLADLISQRFGGVFSVRVRRGPGDIYWNGFLAWRENLVSKGGPKCAVGSGGGWESVWAKGVCVFDEEMDSKMRKSAPVDRNIDDASAAEDATAATATASSSTTVPPNDASKSQGAAIDAPWLPKYDPPTGPDDAFFTVHLPTDLFRDLSEHTRELISTYLWSPEECMFFDWDCAQNERSVYETVTCLWALWAGCATAEQAAAMLPEVVSKFEVVGGLVSGTEESRGAISIDRPNRQWDYPFGWAPHQILAWVGLEKYGYLSDARRLCYRWLYTITKSFVDFNGVVPEKFDVVNMTHKVDVEYGNVGVNFRLVVKEGFGWMNASYQLGLPYLTQAMRRALGALMQPDQLFRKLKI